MLLMLSVLACGSDFTDLAHIADGVSPCPDDFSGDLFACYNKPLPPAPSIRRSLVPTNTSHSDIDPKQGGVGGIGGRIPQRWEDQVHQPDQVADLSIHRATPDGRIVSTTNGWNTPIFQIFFPENLDYGMVTKANRPHLAGGRAVPVSARFFPPLSRFIDSGDVLDDTLMAAADPTPGLGQGPWDDLDDPDSRVPNGETFQWDTCEGDWPDPFPCSVTWTAFGSHFDDIASQTVPPASTDVWEGQCYATNLMMNHKLAGTAEQAEQRSVEIILFAGSPLISPAVEPGTPQGLEVPDGIIEFETIVLPRESLLDGVMRSDGVFDLGSADPYDEARAFHNWAVDHCTVSSTAQSMTCGGVTTTHHWITNTVLPRMAYDECTNGSDEDWCTWGAQHEVRRAFEMQQPNGSIAAWDGKSSADWMGIIEPTTTEDGHVIAHNIAGRIRYSASNDSCSARGFETWRSLSYAYNDPDLFDNGEPLYGFAAEPLRASDGSIIDAGDWVAGAYPWLSSRGEVVMWSFAHAPFGWKLEWVDTGTFDHTGLDPEVQNNQLDRNTVAVVVTGSWTRGKIVHIDNMINFANFKTPEWALRGEMVRLRLYDDDDVLVNPRGSSLINSVENSLNHLEALTPIAPFDVVWQISSSAHHTGELIFDDYMHPRAWVVAHMNETLWNERAPGGGRIDDGFVGSHDFDAMDGWPVFSGSPPLQNASTLEEAPIVLLAGGAFIPPVAEGGVIGKGVFLDGLNDLAWVGAPCAGSTCLNVDHTLVSIWVEPHDLDPATAHTLMSFGDGTVLGLLPSAVVVETGTRHIRYPVPITEGRYTHVAAASYTLGGQRFVRVWVDGEDLGDVNVAAGHLSGEPALIIGGGASDNVGNPPIRGWVDELRVYSLLSGEWNESFFDEWVCNQALGSRSGGECVQLDFRHDDENRADLLWSSAEPLPVGTGLDFAIEAYAPGSCANAARRNTVGCSRASSLGLPALAVGHPRPDATTEPFCQICHATGHPTPGLDLTALVYDGSLDMEHDPRRQPLMWRPYSGGFLPHLSSGAAIYHGTSPGSFDASLDSIVLGTGYVSPH